MIDDPDVEGEMMLDAHAAQVRKEIATGSASDLDRRVLQGIDWINGQRSLQRDGRYALEKYFLEMDACLRDDQVDPLVVAILTSELDSFDKDGRTPWLDTKDEGWKQAYAQHRSALRRIMTEQSGSLDADTLKWAFSLPGGCRVIERSIERGASLLTDDPSVRAAAFESPNPYVRLSLARDQSGYMLVELDADECRRLFEDPCIEVRRAAAKPMLYASGADGLGPFTSTLVRCAADPDTEVSKVAHDMVVYGQGIPDAVAVLAQEEFRRQGIVLHPNIRAVFDDRLARVAMSGHEQLDLIAETYAAAEPLVGGGPEEPAEFGIGEPPHLRGSAAGSERLGTKEAGMSVEQEGRGYESAREVEDEDLPHNWTGTIDDIEAMEEAGLIEEGTAEKIIKERMDSNMELWDASEDVAHFLDQDLPSWAKIENENAVRYDVGWSQGDGAVWSGKIDLAELAEQRPELRDQFPLVFGNLDRFEFEAGPEGRGYGLPPQGVSITFDGDLEPGDESSAHERMEAAAIRGEMDRLEPVLRETAEGLATEIYEYLSDQGLHVGGEENARESLQDQRFDQWGEYAVQAPEVPNPADAPRLAAIPPSANPNGIHGAEQACLGTLGPVAALPAKSADRGAER
ncbi:hypothetical protein WV31_10515 [Magnetospirillum sp. ME-1]|uniref:hypothetical protein n=1 Tax=Magnetospirillum sp. ME-1 TaxID=1639348 RepID=UPI000A17E054|nr:hypothetical protein [Magnetospirillum sp. ME-1]ARJ66060.1 hypothetical protein WV31_10515 [Magnetospirillum sp. ME-1]